MAKGVNPQKTRMRGVRAGRSASPAMNPKTRSITTKNGVRGGWKCEAGWGRGGGPPLPPAMNPNTRSLKRKQNGGRGVGGAKRVNTQKQRVGGAGEGAAPPPHNESKNAFHHESRRIAPDCVAKGLYPRD